jgi:hypothetical protein
VAASLRGGELCVGRGWVLCVVCCVWLRILVQYEGTDSRQQTADRSRFQTTQSTRGME